MNGTSQKVVLKNSKLELTLDTKGGVIKKAVIKDFKSIDGKQDVTLFDENDQNLNFMLAGKQDNIVTADLFFTPSEQTDSTVTMTAVAGNGGEISLKYRLGKDLYRPRDWATSLLLPIRKWRLNGTTTAVSRRKASRLRVAIPLYIIRKQ